MKKVLSFVSVIAVAAVLTSCSVTLPVAISGAAIGTKVGHSTTTVLFRTWQMNKEYGIIEAAKNAGIKGGVATVDCKYTNMIFFTKMDLIVTGE
jgi:hypothetical protein